MLKAIKILSLLRYQFATTITNNNNNINKIPSLKQFIINQKSSSSTINNNLQSEQQLEGNISAGTFHLQTYGCQMNENDSEIVRALLKQKYLQTFDRNQADIVLINTCAIRQAAEQRIHKRIKQLKKHKVIGILGCMAERIKDKMFEEGVHVVCGPDAYRDLPRLIEMALQKQNSINVQLSFEQTYADITPIRKNINNISAFLSIMRGCNNMCSFCIVPFVRGRERSRDMGTILKEIQNLSNQGVKQVTFLGQNVNSYHDTSVEQVNSKHKNSDGFSQTYKLRDSPGYRFQHLLQNAAKAFPNMRFRFTSPHPKDFPEPLLQTINNNYNICNSIHLPAQSGNTDMLYRMRRNHSRQSYLSLVQRIRSIIPNVGLSTDLMCGFCGETQQQFQDTISLLQKVRYDNAFLFAYSMREKTHAHRRYQDDIPEQIKKQRLTKMINTFQSKLAQTYSQQLGNNHLLLIQKISRRSQDVLMGKTDSFKKGYIDAHQQLPVMQNSEIVGYRKSKVGDYVATKVIKTGSRKLECESLGIFTNLGQYYKNQSATTSKLQRLKQHNRKQNMQSTKV